MLSKTTIIIVLNRFTIWEVFVMPVPFCFLLYIYHHICKSQTTIDSCVSGYVILTWFYSLFIYKACRHPTTTWVVGFCLGFFSVQRKTVSFAYGTYL